ncbi:MAG: hypothetical protein K2Q20_10310 [Phycisphaerales bacterium]|nr:hypothetical protein [Phycisphaerales bacterium]
MIYSELDHDLWERRKVEVFADGRKGYADRSVASGGSMLGVEPWDREDLERMLREPNEEISCDWIDMETFEREWATRFHMADTK